MLHGGISSLVNKDVYNHLCVGSNFIAGDCTTRNHSEIYSQAAEVCTADWSVENHTWEDTLRNHMGIVNSISTFTLAQ